MYIRLEEQTIKIRISREEAQKLIDGQHLASKTELSDDFSISYRVETTIEDSSFTSKCCKFMVLSINKHQLASEIEDRPSKDGIYVSYREGDVKLDTYLVVNLKKKRKTKS